MRAAGNRPAIATLFGIRLSAVDGNFPFGVSAAFMECMMKLDRNINGDGKGKYALVRLRDIDAGSEAAALLQRLHALGHLDWGCVNDPDEFFVVKLRDRFAPGAIKGYADAVMDASQKETDPAKSKDLAQWAIQVIGMNQRAGDLSPYCKEPD
jgi:hypothetical protein